MKRRRSAGIPVSRVVHRLLRAGDAARGAGQWGEAAAAYEVALRQRPDLHHIWMQLGHARAQTGDLVAADRAYVEAGGHGAAGGDVALFRGHVAKMAGERQTIGRMYHQAALAGRADALSELLRALPIAIPAATLDAALRDADGDPFLDIAADSSAPGRQFYDVSDFVAHLQRHRSVTGIQRFQVEVATRVAGLVDENRSVDGGGAAGLICCYVGERRGIVAIPTSLLRDIAALSRQGSNPREEAWLRLVARLSLHLHYAPTVSLRLGDTIFTLGAGWIDYGFMGFLADAKRDAGIRYVAAVHDLVPVMVPQYCVRGISEEYIYWLIDALKLSDRFICISQSTARDLVAAAERLNVGGIGERAFVVPLDADTRSAIISDAPAGAADTVHPGDEIGPFVLMVSTIEPRKNHLLALDAWEALLARHGAGAVPTLVLAGRRGWDTERVDARLAGGKWAGKVRVEEGVSDQRLAALYRDCLFTLYPSHYEGWGLPVTESLCYGKLPVVADGSSLPEAGAGFASFFENGSLRSLVAVLERAIGDPEWLREREGAIVAGFAPRPWSDIARAIETIVEAAGERPAVGGTLPVIATDIFLPLGRYTGTAIWPGLDSGAWLKSGPGWLFASEKGCGVAATGASLRLRLATDAPVLSMFVLLDNPYEHDVGFALCCGERRVAGVLEGATTRWAAALALDGDEEGAVTVEIGPMFGGATGAHPGAPLVRVVGVYVCADDRRDEFLQALVTGALHERSSYALAA